METWKAARLAESAMTVVGLLFEQNGINIPSHAELTVDVQGPHTVIDPADGSGDIGVLDGFSATIM